jgi:predicted dienelactone hydrolase
MKKLDAPQAILLALVLAAPFCVFPFLVVDAASSVHPAPSSGAARPATRPYKREAGPYPVAVVRYDWVDARRKRTMPVKIYYPANGKGPFPILLFSHRLGGSREGYEYLGRHWASHGYVSVHVEHTGSDAAVVQGKKGADRRAAVKAVIADPRIALARPADVRFVLDQMARLERGLSPLSGRLDLRAVGAAGHSFGAWTALAVAGQSFLPRGPGEVAAADPRVKAVIAMSAPVPHDGQPLERTFRAIQIPILHMTGTEDESPLGETAAVQRRVPFDRIAGVDQYLIDFAGGDHLIFSDRERDSAKERLFRDLILMSSTAFWDTYLKGDATARSWLADGGFAAMLAREGTFERKLRGASGA